MRSSLDNLNLDVVFHIARFLDFRDLVHLSLSCRQLYGQLHEEIVCNHAVECHVPNALEAKEARARLCTHRDAFQRIYRRHAAVASATPAAIREIGYASSYHYKDGRLSWISDDSRFCTAHIRQKEQAVVTYDLSATLGEHLGPQESTLLLSSLGSVAVLTIHRESRRSRLLVVDFDIKSQNFGILVERKVRNLKEVFARQTFTHVVFGYHAKPTSTHDEAAWLMEIIPLENPPKFDTDECSKLRLYPGFGASIGRDVEFVIHEDYFYAVSTRLANKLVDGEWSSFYECMCISLRSTPYSWHVGQLHRRRAREGPTHDTWTNLQLVPSETTDELMIVETRREWVDGSSHQVRSCYVQILSRLQTLSGSSAGPNGCSSWIHHDCAMHEFRPSELRYCTYNLSAGAFLDVGLDEHELRFRVSSASNKGLTPEESKRSQLTAKGREEKTILVSRTCHSYSMPFKNNNDDDDMENSGLKGRQNEVSAVADERLLVLLAGPSDYKNKQLVLVNFDQSL